MLKIENNQIYSDSGKTVHKLGTDTYFTRRRLLKGEKESDFEEVDEIPFPTKSEYDNKVSELIRERYTASEEFAIQRKMINASNTSAPLNDESALKAISEYDAYNTYVEECKLKAKNPDLYTSTEDPNV